ncbi:hypothetical protein ES705_37369 [subsurface metagenome]
MRTENGEGYLKIGNKTIDDLIDNKKIDCKMRAYFLTVRMVNGWNKESLQIPVSTYSNRLGIDLRYTKRLLKKLTEENMIHRNGSLTSIPGDYIQWWGSGKNLPPPGVVKILQKGGQKLPLKQWSNITTLNTPTLQVNTPEVFYMKLSRKEIEKLESERWYRAVMWNYGKFSKEYIEKTIKDYDYNTRMSCWYLYQEASNVRNKEAYFSKLLENYQAKEEL